MRLITNIFCHFSLIIYIYYFLITLFYTQTCTHEFQNKIHKIKNKIHKKIKSKKTLIWQGKSIELPIYAHPCDVFSISTTCCRFVIHFYTIFWHRWNHTLPTSAMYYMQVYIYQSIWIIERGVCVGISFFCRDLTQLFRSKTPLITSLWF